MTKDNKDLKITDKKFVVPSMPKTETRIILEQQDLYPDLGYEDISSSKSYGPTDNKKKSEKDLITLEETKKYWEYKRDGMVASLVGQALGPLAIPVGGGAWVASEARKLAFMGGSGNEKLDETMKKVGNFGKNMSTGATLGGLLGDQGAEVIGNGLEALDMKKHISHKEKGIEHQSGCPICGD
jgi:hypothetical protein